MILPMQVSNKQRDPKILFLENGSQIQQTQWSMGNVKSVLEKF